MKPVVKFEPVIGEQAVLFCQCGGPLTPTVAVLAGGLVELTGIGCRQCRTQTPVRAGLMNTREAARLWNECGPSFPEFQ
jgi:hypothetical protein